MSMSDSFENGSVYLTDGKNVWENLFETIIAYSIYKLNTEWTNTEMAAFTQKSNTVVNPVFEFLIRLCSHPV